MHALIDRARGTTGLMLFLVAANLATWFLALLTFANQPAALGTAALAYLLGLKHGFDADHVAAIDAASRKLVQQGRSAKTSGLFFALGHSTIVAMLALLLAIPTRLVDRAHVTMPEGFSLFGTIVSVTFLLALSLVNAVMFARLWRQRPSAGQRPDAVSPVSAADRGRPGGPLVWLLRGLFRFVGRAWHMYPIGLLFGLGFDTASEVALLALSTERAAQGASLWMIMIYPALFAAGMSLVDTIDSVLINRAYVWAGHDAARHRSYNLVITAVTILFALAVGALELGNMVGSTWSLSGPLWSGLRMAWDNSGWLGLAAVILVISWNFAPGLRQPGSRQSSAQ